ncbi:pyridoxamine 5'-phosphate oxidase [Aneurinibacillus soli]|uniref:Pyridoxamine 5'-phosphate oxidase N-terminal domain-containing protein n=1 Tax=Aneurinibacillus soli TaxID=1500254 RepID=A0A0U4WFF3_9BACL|nr:pyridoxamine 5'-phosphate oxidase family protein [Aneurinibacillus soli]PYE63603.1 pyridoxamine 5'-phosphate oxidase [Aneurinibacillus soli]BAU27464.1 hypothetical protein CB4_01638 [Aneurinibacillus soli]
MPEVVAHSLSQELLALLRHERFAMLSTISKQTGSPYTSALSWVYALDCSTVRLAVNSKSSIIENVAANSQAALNVFAAGSFYAISGQARIVQERMEDVPLKLTLIELAIAEVRDVMFYGSRIATEPQYVKTYDEQAAKKLDMQVMNALKNA